ncbi:uncharacterized protein LOC128670139 isoform X2 [Plodia interpunctella]|uniref:uncharacterized protein LOC128670139 isoform X2 n=1 Tax=Plodia interpunctella TaxID=58824 RepID=UPI0023683217|nr:uncharacterized protein LOC128670139 isoform X2 [Plodia interpunctella]
MAAPRTNNSMETILTFENRDISQWSAIWSTTHVTSSAGPNSTGWHNVRRRRTRIAALSLGAFLTMHCKVTAAALTGGYFIFLIFLALSVVALANPLRHFEVYLGQWSISGPGRAFRILPMFDGIGIAMCINALVRAITCCIIAAITGTYLMHSVSDEKLPYTYCRDFELKPYDPILKDVTRLQEGYISDRNIFNSIIFNDWRRHELSQLAEQNTVSTTVGFSPFAWRNTSLTGKRNIQLAVRQFQSCNESYNGSYPALYDTPAYNFFYVEVVHLRPDYSLKTFNTLLICSIITIWIMIWLALVTERILNKRITWNRTYLWFVIVPCVWGIVLIVSALSHLPVLQYNNKLKYGIKLSANEMFVTVANALEVAIYIHAAALGTELIYGKGLNHYASGHIDPYLNGENVWHSVILTLLAALHSIGASACAFVDYLQLNRNHRIQDIHESTLWVIPMYSKCVTEGTHKYLKNWEQLVVACLIIPCICISVLFATNGGVLLLESVDATMTAVTTPTIVLLELVAMLFVYRGRDFQSDMNLSMEENACGSRIDTQWNIIPFLTLATLVVKSYSTVHSELPSHMLLISMVPVILVVLAMLLRAIRNAYVFLQH